ncbi:MAG: glycosyltransferase family 2 protein [Phycisphaerae bacterium]|nr:glycosyltransferase family 2 protein [Phycisphaerae bacterium]
MKKAKKVSVVVPVYNEQDNVIELAEKVYQALTKESFQWELIIVDDGSTDQTVKVIREYQKQNKAGFAPDQLRVVSLRRNFGQTSAMAAGFDHASGDVIVPMDGDLQNDPADIAMLVGKLEDGYDVVSGWRKNRKDKAISRKLPSKIANWAIGVITGVKLHDYGCSLKAYRREIVEHINLYGEMHRFIPAIASWAGAKVTEMPVNHHARTRGKTKYGINRTFKVVLDLITVKFLGTFSTKPLHIFGGIGMCSLLMSFLTGGIMLWQKFSERNLSMNRNPLLILSAILVMMSVQFLLMGLLAEMMCRTYHESQNKPTYVVRDVTNIGDDWQDE